MNNSKLVESRVPISEALTHKKVEGANSLFTVPSLHIINSAVQAFCTQMEGEYGKELGAMERVCYVRGVAMMTGFCLAHVKHTLRCEYANSSFGEEPLPETSQARLAEVAISFFQVILGFHQAARYITAVAATNNENDITPELIIAKDDDSIAEFYNALRAAIPEFSLPPMQSKQVH